MPREQSNYRKAIKVWTSDIFVMHKNTENLKCTKDTLKSAYNWILCEKKRKDIPREEGHSSSNT